MANHLDEEEQVEDLKRWFNENWKSLAAGLALGLALVGGWQGWTKYRDGRSAAASQLYGDLNKALQLSKADEAKPIADKLKDKYANTPYATLAALQLAANAANAQKLDEAAAELAWAAEHGSEKPLRQLARLRQARVLFGQGKTDEALKLVDQDGGEYAALYSELRGDIAYTKGDRDTARTAYQAALDKLEADAANSARLQQKLDDVGGTAEAAPVKS